MSTTMPPNRTRQSRRRLLGIGAAIVTGAPFVGAASSVAQIVGPHTPVRRPHGAFDSLKQIEAGPLNVGYAEDGPVHGPPVILLHGWPYDIHAFVEVVPILAGRGLRVIVPYLRGYGTTRFLSQDTPRNGQQAALASDVLALMDALGIQQATLAGFDWGARTACIVAAHGRTDAAPLCL